MGNKYTNEAEKMNWMEPNSIDKVLSYEELKSYLLNLSLPDFMNEIIKIFKEDGIWFDVLSLCLDLKKKGDFMEGELTFPESKIYCRIMREEPPHIKNVGELELKIIEPIPEFLGLNIIDESAKYLVDEFYYLELNLSRNSERKISSLNLKHIRNKIKKAYNN